MHFIDVPTPGGSEQMVIAECDALTPTLSEVLIDVAYAGVNRPDVFQRMGAYPAPPGASTILGLEVSGRISSVGADVTQWQVGDVVCALTNGGGYAERVCVEADHCLPVPSGLSLKEAAALPETMFTVWSNVFDRGRLARGETFLVHAGASGIGSMAIQMAKAMGARVITTASSREKCDVCLKLGADVVINYNEQDFVAVVKEVTDGCGADVILDMVGGDYIPRNISAAAIEGRIISIAFLRGPQVEMNLMPVMLKRLTLTGSTLRPQSVAAKTRIAAYLHEDFWPLLELGKIKPLMHPENIDLADAPVAHELMESNKLIGKLVLAVNPTLELENG